MDVAQPESKTAGGNFPCLQTIPLESGRNTIEQGRAIEIAGLLGLNISEVGRELFAAWQEYVRDREGRER